MATQDSLPTLKNLELKNIRIDNSCIFYDYPNEDIVHALFECLKIQPLWNVYIPCFISAHHMDSFIDMLIWVIKREEWRS